MEMSGHALGSAGFTKLHCSIDPIASLHAMAQVPNVTAFSHLLHKLQGILDAPQFEGAKATALVSDIKVRLPTFSSDAVTRLTWRCLMLMPRLSRN